MISIETVRYPNGLWMVVREWDGIDRPDYTKVFRLMESENEFGRGRFERMKFESKSSNNKIVIDDDDNFDVEMAVDWIAENTNGKWYLGVDFGWGNNIKCYNTLIDAEWIFYFSDESDAVAFKLGCM